LGRPLSDSRERADGVVESLDVEEHRLNTDHTLLTSERLPTRMEDIEGAENVRKRVKRRSELSRRTFENGVAVSELPD